MKRKRTRRNNCFWIVIPFLFFLWIQILESFEKSKLSHSNTDPNSWKFYLF